jgi:hypothetical protein
MTPDHVINRQIGRRGGYRVRAGYLIGGPYRVKRCYFVRADALRFVPGWPGYATPAAAWEGAAAAVAKANSEQRNGLTSRARKLFRPAP